MCMWSRLPGAQYSCAAGLSRASHSAAVAAWHACRSERTPRFRIAIVSP